MVAKRIEEDSLASDSVAIVVEPITVGSAHRHRSGSECLDVCAVAAAGIGGVLD
jgi:hypothetical protein